MRIIIIFFLALTPFLLLADESEKDSLRAMFYKAAQDQEAAISLIAQLELEETPGVLVLGYKGMAHILMSKYAWRPFKKLDYFKTGKGYLEDAILQDPNVIELRFLRITVQSNIPFFLNYNDDLLSDKDLILSEWESIEEGDLKSKMREYLLNSEICSSQEKDTLREFKKAKYE